MKIFHEKFIAELELTELDSMYPFYESEDQDEPNQVRCDKLDIWTESPSADIDFVIEILQELKQKGANRVYLYDHADHRGYYFTGVKLEQ